MTAEGSPRLDAKSSQTLGEIFFGHFAVALLHLLYFCLSFGQLLNFLLYKVKHVIVSLSSGENVRDLRNLKKIPAHLAAVISDPPVRYNDLAKLIAWCHEAGIFYVTLYDFDGLIKSSPNDLLEAAEPLASGKFKIQLLFSSDGRHNELTSRNNVSGVVHVHLASAEDGRSSLVGAARRLHSSGATEVTIANIDQLVKVRSDWPEPDLLIRCGGLHSHMGFHPWTIRLTEFADFYSHKYLLASEFGDLLRTFAKIDRRAGK